MVMEFPLVGAYMGVVISIIVVLVLWRPKPKTPSTYCPVHGKKLKRGRVKIVYGLGHVYDDYFEAHDNLFPCSNKTTVGGCVITNRSPKFRRVNYCQDCRVAEWDWTERAIQREKKARWKSPQKGTLESE
jgi:hypothetical protein